MTSLPAETGALVIRPLTQADWPAVRAVYAEGIATGLATFEVEPPDWATFDARHCLPARLVAVQDKQIIGWAAISPVSLRAVYRGVGEVSVYVAGAMQGRGIGRALLWELIDQSEQAGFWTLQASVFAENSASLALHTGCGFCVVGRRERIGQRDGVWRDTVLLERRSATVGC